MFTGIVETTVRVLKKTDAGLILERPPLFDDIVTGCSIAVAGVCLTVTAFDEATMRFDVVGETWARTNLGTKKEGDVLNVERSVRANGRLEGHIVQGHIEGTAEVLARAADGPWTMVTVGIPEHLLPYVVEKGGIALDGVSLTVAAVDGNRCTVALIPHTLAVTSLGSLAPGDPLNVETDVIARYCHSLLSARHAA